jgi:hypothetical protein
VLIVWDDTGELKRLMRMRAIDIFEQLANPADLLVQERVQAGYPRSQCHTPPNDLNGLAFFQAIAARSGAYALPVGAD